MLRLGTCPAWSGRSPRSLAAQKLSCLKRQPSSTQSWRRSPWLSLGLWAPVSSLGMHLGSESLDRSCIQEPPTQVQKWFTVDAIRRIRSPLCNFYRSDMRCLQLAELSFSARKILTPETLQTSNRASFRRRGSRPQRRTGSWPRPLLRT